MEANQVMADMPGDARPSQVPDNFARVLDTDLVGYAVDEGDLWVETGPDMDEYGPEFMLAPTPGARNPEDVAVILTEAARECPDVPSGMARGCIEGRWFRGDLSDLDAAVDALKHYEDYVAPIGNDKLAYEVRTAFNHARTPLKRLTD